MFMTPSMSPRHTKAPGASTRNRKGSNDDRFFIEREGAGGDDFTEKGQCGQRHRVADAQAEAVQRRAHDSIAAGEGLGPAHGDAVHHDQRDIDAQLQEQRIGVSLHHQLHHGHEGGDDHNEGHDADLGRDDLAQSRDQDVRKREHEGHRNAHAVGIFDCVGDGQSGAESEHKAERRDFSPQSLGELLGNGFRHTDLPIS
jgi:hypothetical protein